VPLDIVIREKSDSGSPVVATAPNTPQAQYYRDIAIRVRDGLAVSSRPTPKIVIEA
jgi:ATP-binding protein involved in chromosome partitioning